jgi:hypothetical protein
VAKRRAIMTWAGTGSSGRRSPSPRRVARRHGIGGRNLASTAGLSSTVLPRGFTPGISNDDRGTRSRAPEIPFASERLPVPDRFRSPVLVEFRLKQIAHVRGRTLDSVLVEEVRNCIGERRLGGG